MSVFCPCPVYKTVQNGATDTSDSPLFPCVPYLNESLGSEIEIASTVSGSNHLFDGDEVYAMDAKGKEHKMEIVSVVMVDAGCKK